MRTRAERRVAARNTWDRLEVSFWFAPAVMALAAVLLAWVMFWLDSQIPNDALASSRFVLSGTPGELRSALLNMAGTVLATAGVVFTLLTLPLSTVAAQYGSRLLRVFLGDRTTQFVLGMFVATFVYCIAAALSIPPADVEPEGATVDCHAWRVLDAGNLCHADRAGPAHQHHAASPQYRGCGGRRAAGGDQRRDHG